MYTCEGSATIAHDRLFRSTVLSVWSLFLFLALISIINLLKITYYPIVHRFSLEGTIHIVLVSDQLDSALVILFAALSSFFTFLAFQRLSGNKWLSLSPLITLNLSALLAVLGAFDLALVLVAVGVSGYVILAAKALKQIIDVAEALLVTICFIEAGSLIHWLLLPLAITSGFTDLLYRFSTIESQLFYAPADLTPVVMLLLLFSFPLSYVIKWLRRMKATMLEVDCAAVFRLNICIDGRILLVVALFLTAFITSYAYLPSINPSGKWVGTDIYDYALWLNKMEANPSQAVEFAIHHGSLRPLFLLVLYYLYLLVRAPTVPFLEWIAIPLFCLLPASVYLFGLAVKDRTFGGLVALFSSFSINVVTSIYTAFYSNMLALSLLYLALAILLLSIRRGSCLLAISSSVPSVLAIFIHPWTWTFIMAALCLFFGVKLLYNYLSNGKISTTLRQLGPLLIFIAANMIVDILKTFLLPVPSGMGVSYGLASKVFSLEEFLRLGFNLVFAFRFLAGGYYNNLSVIASAMVGIWQLMHQKGQARDILVSWLSLAAIPTLFVNFMYNVRIFYDLPLQVLSATGFYFVFSKSSPNKALPEMLLLLFILLNLNYALRSVANLV